MYQIIGNLVTPESWNETQKQSSPISFEKGFWCGQYSNPDYGTCCFMHWRGLFFFSSRRRHTRYQFQEPIIQDLEQGVKYLAIFKPPKMGISELLLSYAVYKSLT